MLHPPKPRVEATKLELCARGGEVSQPFTAGVLSEKEHVGQDCPREMGSAAGGGTLEVVILYI